MTDASNQNVQKIEMASNSVTGGASAIMEAVLLAKSSVIVFGESVVVGDVFGGGTGGHLGRLKEKFPIAKFDGHVRFDDSLDEATGEEKHDYYVVERYGERLFHGSCTGLIEKYFPKFDAEGAYNGMKKRGRIDDPNDEYYQMSKEDVLKQWSETGRDARNHGKEMHKTIEAFLNCVVDIAAPVWESVHNKPALDRFLCMWRTEIVGKIIPLRTELIMFDRRYEFSGQADLIYTRPEWLADPHKCKWIGVGDWKRSKKTFDEKAYGTGFGPCASLPNDSLSKYRLQMSLYASCLMRQTDYEVVELCLGIFHEKHPTYRWIVAEPLYDIADKMLVERRQFNVVKYLNTALSLSTHLQSTHSASPDREEFCELEDAVKSLDGLFRDMTVFGATTEEILGTEKRRRLEANN